MREALLQMIPEFNEIKNADLRERTLKCWELAMERGGWQPADLEKIPFTLLIPNCPASFLEHTRGVVRVAMGMYEALTPIYGQRMPIDRDLLVSGGILHDVGKLLEYRRDGDKYVKSANGKLLRHPFSGAQLAALVGLPDAIGHIIAVHAKEGDLGKRTTEAILVHHADFTNFEPLHG